MYRGLALALGIAPLALLAAGCGSNSPGAAATTTSGPSTSQTLAFVHCMRSHGVIAFPDPNGTGEIPKQQVVTARKADPSQFDAANNACRRFLPNGGNGETAAQIAQDWTTFRRFARCMRADGVPTFPDPTSRSATDRRPTFDLTGAGLNGNSAQLRAKAQHCASQVHLDGLPAAH
jgi:hypothetical protein